MSDGRYFIPCLVSKGYLLQNTSDDVNSTAAGMPGEGDIIQLSKFRVKQVGGGSGSQENSALILKEAIKVTQKAHPRIGRPERYTGQESDGEADDDSAVGTRMLLKQLAAQRAIGPDLMLVKDLNSYVESGAW